jgi:hypothetical protein
MVQPRYLIGGGERLSEEVARPPRGSGEKSHPYSFLEARSRLATQWRAAATAMIELPKLAKPDGQGVIALTLHPSYLAKSYYPEKFVRELNLRHLGSRADHIRPERLATMASRDDERPLPAPLLYLGGDVAAIARFSEQASDWLPLDENVKDDFRKIETIGLPGLERLKPLPKPAQSGTKFLPLEVVLHASPDNQEILEGFRLFADSIGVEIPERPEHYAGGLCFLGARATRVQASLLTQFSFLRTLRSMPRISLTDPFVRGLVPGFEVELPIDPAVAPEIAVAIFDGGLPDNHGLDEWVTYREAPGVGAPIAEYQRHGLAVTSAFLFGPLEEEEVPSQPFANVDHWRVLGDDTKDDDFELYDVLARIEDALSTRTYNFINLSLGPYSAIEDDDVSSWTSTLDSLLAGGETVASVACGNNGAEDSTTGLNRIQCPSDGVNMIAVGATDRPSGSWKRAPYSAVGPGRSPGYRKPEFVTFGGSRRHPFLVLDSAESGGGTLGTSFAAPLALRAATGIRAQFVEQLWAPTMKALLIHQAQPGAHPAHEVGWGRLAHDIPDLIICQGNEAHIIYQRLMPTTGSVRMYLPVPEGIPGNIEIKATFCFFCDIDPEDALNYTRGGLEIQFRPNMERFSTYEKSGVQVTSTVPSSETFFSAKDLYAPEYSRREDAHKWETVFSQTRTKRANLLLRPCFDVSHITRAHGHSAGRRASIRFAMCLTLRSRSVTDLYERVIAQSRAQLQPLRPRTGVVVPVRT